MSINNAKSEVAANRRSWLLVLAWFGTIALVGLLQRILEQRHPF